MEVHPPEHPIHSVRDFFLHLFTITVGLLIALGLEAAVEHFHHVHLVHVADSEMRAEIHASRAELEQAAAGYGPTRKDIRSLVAALQAVREKKPVNLTDINFDFHGASLNHASYSTAQSGGALGLMPYDEAKKFADVYEIQTLFEAEQTTTIDIAAPLLGTLAGAGPALAKYSPQQLDQLIDRLQQYDGHLMLLQALARQLDQQYAEF